MSEVEPSDEAPFCAATITIQLPDWSHTELHCSLPAGHAVAHSANILWADGDS